MNKLALIGFCFTMLISCNNQYSKTINYENTKRLDGALFKSATLGKNWNNDKETLININHCIYSIKVDKDSIRLKKKVDLDTINKLTAFSIIKDNLIHTTANEISISKLGNYNLSKKIKHNYWNNDSILLPFLHHKHFKPHILDSTLYIETFSTVCEDNPLDCNEYPILTEINLNNNKIKSSSLTLEKLFYDEYLKFDAYINAVFIDSTIYLAYSRDNHLYAYNIKTGELIKKIKLFDESKLNIENSDNYTSFLMDAVSFSGRISDIKIDAEDYIHVVFNHNKVKYDKEGLLNYEGLQKKEIIIFDKDLNKIKSYELAPYFSDYFILLKNGYVLFEFNENKNPNLYYFEF